MKVRVYYPLAKFGTVYLYMSPYGPIFYEARGRRAVTARNFVNKIYDRYVNTISGERDYSELPTKEIIINKPPNINFSKIYENREHYIKLLNHMAYHYNQLNKPKKWVGLINLDPHFADLHQMEFTISKNTDTYVYRISTYNNPVDYFNTVQVLRGKLFE